MDLKNTSASFRFFACIGTMTARGEIKITNPRRVGNPPKLVGRVIELNAPDSASLGNFVPALLLGLRKLQHPGNPVTDRGQHCRIIAASAALETVVFN